MLSFRLQSYNKFPTPPNICLELWADLDISDDEKINWDDFASDFWDVLDLRRRSDAGIMTDERIQNSQRKSDKRHSLICMTVTAFIAFRHLFAELCDDKIITWDDFWCNLNGSSFWQFWTLSSVMMPASLLLRESKTSQKSEAKSSQLIFSSSLDRDYRLQKYKKISD